MTTRTVSHTFANGVRCFDPAPIVWANGEDCLHDYVCTCDVICNSGSWQSCDCPMHADNCNAEDPAYHCTLCFQTHTYEAGCA